MAAILTDHVWPPFLPHVDAILTMCPTVSSPNLEEEELVALLLPRCYSELPARRPRDWFNLRSRLLLLADSGGGSGNSGGGGGTETVATDPGADEAELRYSTHTNLLKLKREN